MEEEGVKLVEEYINRATWLIKENANMTFSLQNLNHHIFSQIIKNYWLSRVYPAEIAKLHLNGFFHIHDLGILGPYCVGWDLMDLLKVGFKGAPGKIESRPAKHFRTALLHVVNFMYTLQGEAAGAIAFSDIDVLLAPFIARDHLNYAQVKQAMQEFIYNLNIPTRVGFQTPFTNLTLDLVPPKHLAKLPVVIGGREQEENYGDFADEIEMFNRAFAEVMLEGDAKGRVFTFPIPTYNITNEWDWDSVTTRLIMNMTAKYGIPYFANFVNSDLDPSDIRSMCCRLRLNTGELKKRIGGLFASAPLTGSIGVVTINMPRLGFLARGSESRFFELLEEIMEKAKEALLIKRKFVEKMTENGLYPYSKFYLRNVKEMEGSYWAHHFNTIGLIGMHEALINLFGLGINTKEGKAFAEKTLDFMLKKLSEFQEETEQLFNLEASPAEGASYRLAMIDKKEFNGNIYASGYEGHWYYTNSTWLPVDATDDIFELLEHQESLQKRYTGGTVVHIWLGEAPEPEAVAALLKKITYKFEIPYYTITPTFSICPIHGYIPGKHEYCPYPHTEEELAALGIIKKTGPSFGFSL